MKLIELDCKMDYLPFKFEVSIQKNRFYLVRGGNGSGKSTLIKLILGYLRPSKGFVQTVHRIAYLPERVYLPSDLRADTYLSHILRITKKHHLTFLEGSEIPISKVIRTLSKGNQQKLSILATISLESEVYIFDEPLNGLDKKGVMWFLSCLERLKKEKTILIATHKPKVFEKLIDEVILVG